MMPKVIKAWGGFSDGRLAECGHKITPDGTVLFPADQFAIYKIRAAAREQYQDVCRVEIREIKPRRIRRQP